MKTILISLALFVMGCATLQPDYTIFLREDQYKIKNLKDELCIESGYQLRKQKDGSYRLTVYYLNCDVHAYRLLREEEHKQWILPKN